MFDFDPTYGYSLDQLLCVEYPPLPDGFLDFWQTRYQTCLTLNPEPCLNPGTLVHDQYHCFDLSYRSSDNLTIGGWLLIPKNEPIKAGVVVGHGYGGREGPDFNLPISNAALLFPCFRGLSRSRCWPISEDPNYHVLHDIDKPGRYILGGCVEDLWLAVSALLSLYPALMGHIAYLGISFGGGIGALGLPWDKRIRRAHFNVPSFGNHPLRMQLPTTGSAAALQKYQLTNRNVLATLSYYDAAAAAQCIEVPVHVAAALEDPVVAPPGQFSIYNALPGEKKLFVFDKGHSSFPRQALQEQALLIELEAFFSQL